MGFFGKIKDNLKHGGVKVTMQAAQSVSKQDPNLPVTITVTNGPDQPRTIKQVSVQIDATSYNNNRSSMSIGVGNNYGDNDMNNSQTVTIARVDSPEGFVLQPNESKSISLSIVVNDGAPAPTNGILGHLAGVFATRYDYTVAASADVEGIALDPMAQQTLQIM